jgi:hypothetical protein
MIPFVGSSYDLMVKKSDVQRSINLMPTPVESGTGKTDVFLKPVPGLTQFSAGAGGCSAILLDTFTDTNGTRLVDHVPDIFPAGLGVYRDPPGLEGTGVIQDNKLEYHVASSSGRQDLYNDAEEPFGLTFPYYVWMTASITSGGEIFLRVDGPDTVPAQTASRILIEMFDDGSIITTLWVYDEEGNEVFTWEPTSSATAGTAHTVGFYIEANAATLIVDGAVVSTFSGAMPTDGVYVQTRFFPSGLDPVVGNMTAYGICVGGTLANAQAVDGTAL